MRNIRHTIVLILAFMTLFPTQGFAASLHVTWNANTETDLAGYYVYYRIQPDAYGAGVPVVNPSYDIPNVQEGKTYCVEVSAYDTSNNESAKSSEQSIYIPVSDTTPPTGSVVINSGASTTTSTAVTLTLSASDTQGSVTGMKISNNGSTYSNEIAYAATYSWTLSSGLGTKTVYVLFKDNSGNWMATPATATIELVSTADTTPPTGTVVINSGAATTTSTAVTLTLSASDTQGSVTGMKFSNNGSTYSNEIAYASTYSWTLSSGLGTKTVYALFKDNSGNWMSSPATATIQLVDPCPVANAGPDQNLAPQRVILDGSASYDPNNLTLQYGWSQVSGPVQVIIETPTSSVASFMGIKSGTYRFRLTCSNGSCTTTDNIDVTIQNVAPSVNAGSDRTIDAGTQITLHATGQDPNEDPLTYQWSKVSGPSVTIPGMAQQDITFTPTNAGLYTFSVQCSDGLNYSAASQVHVTVNAVNHAPTANAGTDQDVPTGSKVTLNGTGSSDPDHDALTYSWVQASGPVQVTLSNANTAQPTFTANTAGTYQFNLTVNDGKVNSTPDGVQVRVLSENTPPVASAGADMHAYVGDDVVLDASTSYDPDGNPITYSWGQVSGASVVIFNATTAKPFFTPTTSGVFEFKVTVSDGQATSSDTVIVTVDNLNQVPIANAGSNIVATIGQTVTLNGSASYDPDGTPISYIWAQTGGTKVSLSNSNTARPSFTTSQEGVYVFELKVYDGIDTSSPSKVTVTVQSSQLEVTLVSPESDSVLYKSPTLSWAGKGFKSYKALISIDGVKFTKVYSGSKTSTALHPVLWNWFIPSGTTVKWYVEGTTSTGQVIKSKYGAFTRE